MRGTQLKLVQGNGGLQSQPRIEADELWNGEGRLHSLHNVISYPHSFNPQLVDSLLKRYSRKGDTILDPFCGRGTALLQANILGRIALGADLNPLAVLLSTAKMRPVGLDEVLLRLHQVDLRRPISLHNYQEVFSPFYHPDTFRELSNLRALLEKNLDRVGAFIELLILSRLHGHTSAFFSAYTLSERCISPTKQRLVNLKRRQAPEYRPVVPRLIRRAAEVLGDGFSSAFFDVSQKSRVVQGDGSRLNWVGSESIDFVITQPPLPVEDINAICTDQWIERWFCGVEEESAGLVKGNSQWSSLMRDILNEIARVLRPGSHAALEVAEVDGPLGRVSYDRLLLKLIEDDANLRRTFAVEELLTGRPVVANKAREMPNSGRTEVVARNLLVLRRNSKR